MKKLFGVLILLILPVANVYCAELESTEKTGIIFEFLPKVGDDSSVNLRLSTSPLWKIEHKLGTSDIYPLLGYDISSKGDKKYLNAGFGTLTKGKYFDNYTEFALRYQQKEDSNETYVPVTGTAGFGVLLNPTEMENKKIKMGLEFNQSNSMNIVFGFQHSM